MKFIGLFVVGFLAFYAFCYNSGVGAGIRGKKDPGYWTETAYAYLEHGFIVEVFQAYEEGLQEHPKNPRLLRDFANVLILFRNEAAVCYGSDEDQVLNRAFDLYGQALKSDPGNFELAAEMASSYYLVQPRRPAQAVDAWSCALQLALTEEQREEARLHLLRAQISAGLYGPASNNLVQLRMKGSSEATECLMRRLSEHF